MKAVLALLFTATAHAQSDEAMLKGLVSGCLEQQVRALSHEPGGDEKRSILHFCYCKAGNMAPLVRDADTARKLRLGDSQALAAVKKIDQTCLEAVANGQRFAPGLTR